MHESDLPGMAAFIGTLLVVLGGLWWMLRLNARDLERLERELKSSLPCQGPSAIPNGE